MKRTLIVALLLLATVTVYAAQDYMWIDRVEENGRLLVPLRGIFEAYGAEVGWVNATRTVTIQAPALNVGMQIDVHEAALNGQTKILDAPPRIIDGRTYIPLRFAAEALGEKVKYEGDRVKLPTIGLTLLIRGEAAGPETDPYAVTGEHKPLTITQPTAGTTIGPRVEVKGTAPGGSFLVLETEVRAQDDDELIRVVPGLRHDVPESGNWDFAIAAPSLPLNIADEPLYYIIRAYYQTGGYTSDPVTVKVFRPEQ
ncbi:MAG: copper amine oxidase N-terminal domain-containing protein [Armatimonadota bacterium]